MKSIIYVSVNLVFLFVFIGFTEKRVITVWMIGDSTMAIKSQNKYPETGWGMPFASYFKEEVIVKNHAKNGRSTKSFKNEGLWKEVYENVKAGDYVFIQFGHNDEKVDKPNVGVTPEQFEANLREYVELVKAKNAFPILLTPIARRKFDDGKLQDTHGEYGNIACVLGQKMKVPCIDMRKVSNELLSELGEESSKKLFLHLEKGHVNYPKGVTDNTHLNEVGAKRIAELVARELKTQKIALSSYLK
ncbi:rhamnogalacturonan acetylesterase [Sphingobacterium cavernae]|uniref:rhamnogalacturonan acetylesterase n=1 Tax=Sphingobacterium cavernae TaxID=2592657 RepID=UPI00122FBF91|nr:rhamnogalacturonan acetylesterase [Sphingobacterium cavernae]